MSYSVAVLPTAPHPDCTAEHHRPDDLWSNITSNVAPVWRAAGFDLAQMHGKTTAHVLEALAPALSKLITSPDDYHQFVRGGGQWGDVQGCIRFLSNLRNVCEQNPTGALEVSW